MTFIIYINILYYSCDHGNIIIIIIMIIKFQHQLLLVLVLQYEYEFYNIYVGCLI